MQIPPVLLEPETPVTASVSGPGERYALSATPAQPQPGVPIPDDLPEAYGTERLFLTARDPHWLYAAWDLTSEQRQRYNALSREGHLVLRTYEQTVGNAPAFETPLQPDSKSWFVHVAQASTRYVAELGYYDRNGRWVSIATSTPTLTPPAAISQDAGLEFATIPPEVTLKTLFEVVQEVASASAPLAETIQELREQGWAALPAPVPPAAPQWTPTQKRALAEVVRLDDARRVWMGSLEITEVIRRHLQQEVSSAALVGAPGEAGLPLQPGPGFAAVSSPLGPEELVRAGEKPFWLTVNAELVLYGATEPDARVTIGKREIRLRPDGTFSYRFALPDGEYPLSVRASSADQTESRSTELQFSRRTQSRGHVGAHPQDARLKPPLAAHLS